MNDHHVEELLRSRRIQPLPDNGFAKRVLAQLPPRKRSMRNLLVPAMTCCGGLLTLVTTRGDTELLLVFQGLLHGEVVATLAFFPVALMFAGCLWALSESR